MTKDSSRRAVFVDRHHSSSDSRTRTYLSIYLLPHFYSYATYGFQKEPLRFGTFGFDSLVVLTNISYRRVRPPTPDLTFLSNNTEKVIILRSIFILFSGTSLGRDLVQKYSQKCQASMWKPFLNPRLLLSTKFPTKIAMTAQRSTQMNVATETVPGTRNADAKIVAVIVAVIGTTKIKI